MKTFHFFLILLISIITHEGQTSPTSETFSCLNPKEPNFLQVCTLAFFPPSTEITGNISLAASHDVLIQAYFPSLNVSQLTQNYLSHSLQKLAHLVKLDTISINDPFMQINLGANQAVRFSGVVNLFSLKNLQVDVLAMKATPPSLLLGLSLPFSSFGTVIQSFIPVKIDAITSIFDGDSSLSLVVTNGFSFDDIPELEPEYLTEIESWEEPAVTVYAKVSLTTGSNKISQFLRKYLGDEAALLMVMSVDNSSVSGYVGIADFQITNKLKLKSAGVGIKVGLTDPQPEFSIGASMELTVSDYALVFSGSMTFTPLDLSLEFTMENVWVNAFELKRLSFGNLLLGGGISYAGVPSKFSIGAEISVGLDCYIVQEFVGDGFCLHGKGYVGIDVTEPQNNFFYVEMSSLSLDVLTRALIGSKFDQKVVIPSILNDALQFPDGLMVSYALVDQSVPNLEIKAGYALRGTVSIFGAKATIDVAYYINDMRFKALLYATPINLGNVFTFVGNSSSNGPYLNIDVGIFPSPVFKVEMYATVTLLGIKASCTVYIGIEKLLFSISGPILGGVLVGNFAVELANKDFSGFNFRVQASLTKNQAMLDLITFVSNQVAAALNAAKNEVDKSQGDVQKAQVNVDSKKKEVCEDINSKCSKDVCSQTEEVCSRYGTKSVCSETARECTGGWTDVCTKSESQCLNKVWSWFSWLCRSWGTVCKASSKVCNAWGDVCKTTTQVTDYATCIIKNTVCKATQKVVDLGCKAACEISKAGLDTAVGAMEAAKQIMEGAEKTLGGLAKAFEFLGSQATVIFNIENAGFTIYMNAGNKQKFNVGIDVNLNVIIMGKKYDRTVRFNFADLDDIKKALVDDVLEKIKDVFH